MNDFLKHMKLIESIDVNEDQYEDEFNLDPEEVGIDEPEQLGSYDVDDELDMEIARSVSDDFDMEPDELESGEFDVEPDHEAEPEVQEPVFNYTATIQIHGYDFPLVLQADDMDEIKTVMQVLKQSGLNPQGDYKWNSKTFEIDLDESMNDDKLDKE